jgi:hypothetical protein
MGANRAVALKLGEPLDPQKQKEHVAWSLHWHLCISVQITIIKRWSTIECFKRNQNNCYSASNSGYRRTQSLVESTFPPRSGWIRHYHNLHNMSGYETYDPTHSCRRPIVTVKSTSGRQDQILAVVFERCQYSVARGSRLINIILFVLRCRHAELATIIC